MGCNEETCKGNALARSITGAKSNVGSATLNPRSNNSHGHLHVIKYELDILDYPHLAT